MVDIVRIGDATLYHGDCLEILPTLGKFDAVITDPPYFLPANHYSTRKKFCRNFSDLGVLEYWLKDVFAGFDLCSNDSAHWYLFCDGQSYPLFYWHAHGFTKSCRPVIWDKKTSINGYAWRHQHEIILYCERSKAGLIPTGDGDILYYKAEPVGSRLHPAQKPIDLLRRLAAKVGAETVDPFMGSGSTGIAVLAEKKKFTGIEIERKYFDIACERIENAQRQGQMIPHDPAPKPEQQSMGL